METTTLYIHRFKTGGGIAISGYDMEAVSPSVYVLVKTVEVDLGDIPEIDEEAEVAKEKARKIAHLKSELAKMGVVV